MSSPTNLKPWNVLGSKVAHATPWVEVVEDRCVADGKELTYTYSRRVDEGPLIIAEEHDGRLWLVRQYRHPIKKIIWQFPAEGKLPDESWQDAASRGLAEELQRSAQQWTELGSFFVDPGGSSQKYHAFLATGLSKLPTEATHLNDQEVEHLEIAAFTRSEIDQLILSGAICDNWTLSGLFLYDRMRV